eukprot:3932716-Alexandrium_andersonii.AAC.1
MHDEGDWEGALEADTQMKKARIQRKTDFTLRNVEEELWKDIKKGKIGFAPNHIKLSRNNEAVKP